MSCYPYDFFRFFYFTHSTKQRISMSQQILPSNNVQHDDNDKINCYGYIIDQCSIYTERIGTVMKKILCKSWPLLSKQSTRKRNKEVNIDFLLFRKQMTHSHMLISLLHLIYYSDFILRMCLWRIERDNESSH